jgi:hypothetical protein
MQSFKQFLKEEEKVYPKSFKAYTLDGIDTICQYTIVNGSLTVDRVDESFTNLEKFPRTVTGRFDIKECNNLTSLEGGPLIVNADVTISSCEKLTSLAGIGKRYLKDIYGTLGMTTSIKSSILGILLIKHLDHFYFFPKTPKTKAINAASNILLAHFEGDKDMMDCHEELTRAGLKEFAKL